MIVFKRDSFSTDDLRNSLSYMNSFVKDISKKANSKRSFTNFDGELSLEGSVQLNGKTEQTILNELKAIVFTAGETKVIEINTNSLSLRSLDRVMKKVHDYLSAVPHFNVLVGTNAPVAVSFIQQQQSGSNAATAWLTPTLLNAILISLTILVALWCAFGMALDIKTPVIFVEKSIDFGKIEK